MSWKKTRRFLKPSTAFLGALIAAAPTLAKAVGYPSIPHEPAIVALGVVIAAASALWSAIDQGATTETITGHLTGGDSYATCSVQPVCVPGRAEELALCIEHHGEYPIPDAAVEVTAMKPGNVVEPVFAARVGTLHVGQVTPLCALPALADTFRWQIRHLAPNGARFQSLACDTISGQRVFASRTWALVPGGPIAEMKVFEETIDQNFPRDIDGQVDWSGWDRLTIPAEAQALIKRRERWDWFSHPIRSGKFWWRRRRPSGALEHD